MACNVVKTPIMRSLAIRRYSNVAKTAVAKTSDSLEVESTTLPNKLLVASAENANPNAKVSIVFRAGSRDEVYDTLGTTHALRVLAGNRTECFTPFAITRNLDQSGANLYCTTDRETISYTLEVKRDELAKGLVYLAEVATRQCIRPWDLQDNIHRLGIDLALLPKPARAIDLLHKAAFRSGLGNSLYVHPWRIGKLNNEEIQKFVNEKFLSNHAAVVGLGVDHKKLVEFAQCLEICTGSEDSSSANYFGGELRKDKGGDLAYVALAVHGASLADKKEALAFAILQQAIGTSPSVKYGKQSSPLYKAVDQATCGEPFSATAINCSHRDNGLFGVLVVAAPENAGAAVEAAVKVLRNTKLSDADIARAKVQLKNTLLMDLENSSALLSDMGRRAVLLGAVQSVPELVSAIDTVTCQEVIDAAKRAAAGKLSLAALGNLSTVPYLDQLK